MGFSDWNSNWGNWGNGKGKGRGKNWFQSQGFNRASPYFGGAQSATSQLGNALGEMANMAEACRIGQILNQSSWSSPGQVQTPGQNATAPGTANNPQDGQTLVTSLQNVLDTALQRAQSNGTGAQSVTPGANAVPATQTSSTLGAGAAGGTAVAANATPMAAMDQATFNIMLSRNEQFTGMQGDVTSLRSSMTSLNQNVQRQFQTIQASQNSGFSEMRAMLSRIAGGGSECGAAGRSHARAREPSAVSGANGGPGGASCDNSSVPDGRPPVLPTATVDDAVHLNSKGDITTGQHDKIVDILGIKDGSAQACKARPDRACPVADWWYEFKKAKKLGGWQTLLKGMGVAAAAADEIDCLDDVLPLLIDALDTPLDWGPGFPITGA